MKICLIPFVRPQKENAILCIERLEVFAILVIALDNIVRIFAIYMYGKIPQLLIFACSPPGG